jgi:hypothetical protein
LIEQFRRLRPEERRKVLDFARTLGASSVKRPQGWNLRRFAGAISRSDLDLISAAIEADCEQVRHDEW